MKITEKYLRRLIKEEVVKADLPALKDRGYQTIEMPKNPWERWKLFKFENTMSKADNKIPGFSKIVKNMNPDQIQAILSEFKRRVLDEVDKEDSYSPTIREDMRYSRWFDDEIGRLIKEVYAIEDNPMDSSIKYYIYQLALANFVSRMDQGAQTFIIKNGTLQLTDKSLL